MTSLPTKTFCPKEQPAYKDSATSMTPIAQQVAKRVLSLPMGADLTEKDQNLIINNLS